MKSATIEYNEGKESFCVVFPDDDASEVDDVPDDGIALVYHGDVGFLTTLHNYDPEGPLKSNTVYQLVAVPTTVDEDVEFDEEDDETDHGVQPRIEEDDDDEGNLEPGEIEPGDKGGAGE
jgi:hypothetical protein